MTTPLFPNRTTGSGDPAADINALRDDAVSKRGGATITPATASTKGLVVRAASGQSASLIEVQDAVGNPKALFNIDGDFRTNGVVRSLGATGVDPGGMLGATASTAASRGLVVRGAASQTANLAEFQNSAGTVLASVAPTGTVTAVAVTAGLIRADSNFQVMNRVTTARTGGSAPALPAQPVAYYQFADQDGNVRYFPGYS